MSRTRPDCNFNQLQHKHNKDQSEMEKDEEIDPDYKNFCDNFSFSVSFLVFPLLKY